MFEKYDVDKLFHCEIYDMIPYYIENFGGCYSITGESRNSYETVVYYNNGRYIDVNNPDRIINVFESPSAKHPIQSRDFHLYSLNVKSLSKFENRKQVKSLRKVPFVSVK